LIDTPQGISELLSYLQDKEFIAFDTETTGLTKSAEIIGFSVCAEEEKAFYVVLSKWNSTLGLLESTNITEEAKQVLNLLTTKNLIMHNAIFDIRMVNNNYKISLLDALHTDTLILAHLLNENRSNGLKELGKFYFGETAETESIIMKESITKNGGKITKSEYELYKADVELIGKYGAKDAILTYKLFNVLLPELCDEGLETFFYEEESMPLFKSVTYQLNDVGLKIDVPGVISLGKQLEAECIEARSIIYKEIETRIKDLYPGTNKKNTFNIGSPSQVSWLAFGAYGLEFATLTKEGKNVCKHLMGKLPYALGAKKEFIRLCQEQKGHIYSPEGTLNGKKIRAKKIKDPWTYITADKNVLKKYENRYIWIQKYLEYQKKTKLLNTYVEGIKEYVDYGILYPSFLQHGTTSGRYSSKNINFQNLPRDDKRIKKCVIARPGKTFVGLDYSQLEPRVFAYISDDTNLLNAFKSGEDFYSTIGVKVYKKYDATPYKEGSDNAFGIKYPNLRNISKVIALATVYGASPAQLAKTTGKSIEETAEDMQEYLAEFPGVAKLMTESHNLAKKQGYVANIFGRKRRMPDAKKIDRIYGKQAHADLPYEARKMLNLATNHRIQSTAASIVNRSMINFVKLAKDANIDCKIVTTVHDSIIVECNEQDSQDVAQLLQYAAEYTIDLKTIALEAIPKIGKSFADV